MVNFKLWIYKRFLKKDLKKAYRNDKRKLKQQYFGDGIRKWK
jgi:hypothetical protein